METLLDGQIKHRFFLSIVNACDTAEIGLFVIGLHLIHNLCWQVFHGHVLVVPKKLLTAHKDSTHGLSIHFDGTVFYRHAWQFFDKVLQHTSFWHFESIGIEDEGVVLHLHLFQFACHHCLVQLDAVLLHQDSANGYVALICLSLHVDAAEEVAIAYIGNFQNIIAVLHTFDGESAIFRRRISCNHTCRVCTHDSHGTGNQCLTCFAVDNFTCQC